MFQLQIKRKRQEWRTIRTAGMSDNVVVQAMAYATNKPGYPQFRILDPQGDMIYLTNLDGTTYENDPAFERIRSLVKRVRESL